jgi:hypothetical protein
MGDILNNIQKITPVTEKYIYRACIKEARSLDRTLLELQNETEIDGTVYPAWEVISVTPISVEHYDYDKGHFNTTDFMIIYRIKETKDD